MTQDRYRIYVSEPISGADEKESKEAFRNMRETLEGLGYEAVNPWYLAEKAEGNRWADYVLNDLGILRDCDGEDNTLRRLEPQGLRGQHSLRSLPANRG